MIAITIPDPDPVSASPQRAREIHHRSYTSPPPRETGSAFSLKRLLGRRFWKRPDPYACSSRHPETSYQVADDEPEMLPRRERVERPLGAWRLNFLFFPRRRETMRKHVVTADPACALSPYPRGPSTCPIDRLLPADRSRCSQCWSPGLPLPSVLQLPHEDCDCIIKPPPGPPQPPSCRPSLKIPSSGLTAPLRLHRDVTQPSRRS